MVPVRTEATTLNFLVDEVSWGPILAEPVWFSVNIYLIQSQKDVKPMMAMI